MRVLGRNWWRRHWAEVAVYATAGVFIAVLAWVAVAFPVGVGQ